MSKWKQFASAVVISTAAFQGACFDTKDDSGTAIPATDAPRSATAEIASPAPASATSSTELIAKGRALYMAQCTSCHNTDPKIVGAIGPEVIKPSLDLLEKKILEGKYPAGFKPKRPSQSMTVMPFLKPSIPALHAYLNSL